LKVMCHFFDHCTNVSKSSYNIGEYPHCYWYRSVKGFRVGGGHNAAFPIDFDRRCYNTIALRCECVVRLLWALTAIIMFCKRLNGFRAFVWV